MARIYAVGGVVAVVERFEVDQVLNPGLTRLAVGGIGLPVLFLALALALAAFPRRSRTDSARRRLRRVRP